MIYKSPLGVLFGVSAFLGRSCVAKIRREGEMVVRRRHGCPDARHESLACTAMASYLTRRSFGFGSPSVTTTVGNPSHWQAYCCCELS
ncbi:hypothetical protein F4780DRAFT_726291 [Xylariomycetidae sp. FL0641]|nr:hypothetical protein F4780DRAFT_726291 [Xylariomycetidae sp. FL0641]